MRRRFSLFQFLFFCRPGCGARVFRAFCSSAAKDERSFLGEVFFWGGGGGGGVGGEGGRLVTIKEPGGGILLEFCGICLCGLVEGQGNGELRVKLWWRGCEFSGFLGAIVK